MTAAAITAKTAFVPVVTGMTAGAIARDVTRILALVTTATAQAGMGAVKVEVGCAVVEYPQ